MPNYRSQFSINTADNIPANAATNTFHISAADVSNLEIANNAIRDFYLAIDSEFSSLARLTDGLTWKSYDLADPEPRAPVTMGSANLSLSAGDPLPPEVALCVSFQAAPTSGVPQARRRNRIYLPFFKEAGNGADGRPTSTLIDTIVAAAEDLWDLSEASTDDWDWVVYSPTNDTIYGIDNGWVDNEWDTQRRRGRPSTSRTVWP